MIQLRYAYRRIKPTLRLTFFQPKHRYEHLDVEFLKGDRDANILRKMSHGLGDLGALVMEFAPESATSQMSYIQQVALARHRNYRPAKSVNRSKPSFFKNIIRDYFQILDDLYFFGTLKDKISLGFRTLKDLEEGDVMGTCHTKVVRRTVVIDIYIDLEEHKNEDWSDEWQETLGTLAQ